MAEAPEPRGRVLVIAGSDSGGGAGIQADIKTITVLGGYAATAITALTAQNTLGVFGVVPVDPAFVAEQIAVVLSDIGADAVKTGMLFSEATIGAVASALEARARRLPIIVDPVMVAKGGTALLQQKARVALVERLLPLAALITPNAPEAAALSGIKVETVSDMERAADTLLAFGASAVLIKGGHVPGDVIVDVLRTADGESFRFEHPRIVTKSTHGTGCTLATAIACGLAQQMRLKDAVARAHNYVQEAIKTAPGLGSGAGPLNHAQ